MSQNQQKGCEALLAIHNLIGAIAISPEHERLEAIKLFRLRILPFREFPDVVQKLGHLRGRPAVTALVGWNTVADWSVRCVDPQVIHRLQADLLFTHTSLVLP